MKTFAQYLFGLALLVAIVFAFAANTAVKRHYDAQAAPQSAYQMMLTSRQTAADERHEQTMLLLGIGLAATAVVIVGSLLLMIFGGTKALREWRLARRRQTPRRNRPNVPRTIAPITRPYEPPYTD